MDNKSTIGGLVGNVLGVVGTSLQTEEVLRIISLIITIVGAIITWIVIPIINWYNKAKADGKIDSKELDEGITIISDGIDKVQEQVEQKGEKDESKN